MASASLAPTHDSLGNGPLFRRLPSVPNSVTFDFPSGNSATSTSRTAMSSSMRAFSSNGTRSESTRPSHSGVKERSHGKQSASPENESRGTARVLGNAHRGGKDSTEESQEREYKDADLARAKSYALKLLAGRPLSQAMLREKMTKRETPEELQDAVLAYLDERGFQSDLEFAKTFSYSHFRDLHWGPYRIKQELFRKGVSEGDTDKAIHYVFHEAQMGGPGLVTFPEDGAEDDDSDADDDRPLSPVAEIGAEAWARLKLAAKKQWEKSRGLEINSRNRRLAAWLSRRGYPWPVIGTIVCDLQDQEMEV